MRLRTDNCLRCRRLFVARVEGDEYCPQCRALEQHYDELERERNERIRATGNIWASHRVEADVEPIYDDDEE